MQATNKEPSIQNAVFEKNTIKNSGDSGILILGSDTIDATFLKNDIDNPALYGIRILSTVSGKLNFLKNTVKSAGNAPFSNASTIARVISDMPNDPNAGDGGSGEDYVAVQGSPAIDGVVDSLWQNSSLLQLNTDENGTTGTSRIAWDDSALYYLFQIQDATPNAVSTNENNDSVEVWVDETNA
ncbi:hypothetical protein K0U00_46325, partial [Paenibacillus sepulcri]|nr:hypothetical protein [Paenibacillus sepulcri]